MKLKYLLGDEIGWRHLELANLMEDKKVLIYAIEQFQLAAERADGPKQVLGAKALDMMQKVPTTRAEKYYHYPTKKERIRYREMAAGAHKRDRKAWKRLADFAASHSNELMREAVDGYERLIEDHDDLLEIDGKGRILLPEGPIPEAFSNRFRDSEGTILVNDQIFFRNSFLKSIPNVRSVYMKASKEIRVFSEEGGQILSDLHALGKAIYSHLKKDFDDRPDRPLDLFLFSSKGAYENYSYGSGDSLSEGSRSFTNREHFTSVVYFDSKKEEKPSKEELHSMVICELVRLYHYGITKIRMPDWYDIALTETYGGLGAFQWKGSRLKVKRMVDSQRIGLLKEPGGMLDLNELLFTSQIGGDKTQKLRYSLQSWAFLRFLREGANTKITRKFDQWEEYCISRVLDENAALEKFHLDFLKDLDKMEHDFKEYVRRL